MDRPEKENPPMDVMIDLCMVPMGVGVSVSAHIARCQRELDAAGVKHTLHAYGTTVEGEWDTVMAAVKRCHQAVHDMGVQRIFTVVKIGTRIDKPQTAADKVASVRDKLAADPPGPG
jgi:uncharacterized protein (TIGR00106 family)